MPQITNDYNRVELRKLTSESGGSGPFIVMQNGYDPADKTFKESVFLLRRDGKWVDFVALGASGNPELWDDCVFEKSADVVKLLNTHKLDADVFSLELNPEALASWLTRTSGLSAQQRIDNLISLHNDRLRDKKS